MTTRYTFGVEFEVVLPSDTASHHVAAQRLALITALPVITGSRTATTRQDAPEWRIVSDGSIRGGAGAEFVSPVLRGDEGIAQVKKIADALQVMGATANGSCGFHVHVGGVRGADLGFFKRLVKLYARFEPVIDSFMPPSRRGNSNTYCRGLSAANVAAVDNADSFDRLIQAATGLPASTYNARFFKLNLVAFRKHRTVEFRQHAGTVDSAKAIAWIKTCLRMVAAAAAGKTGDATAAPAPESFAALPAKARKVAEFVTRPEGATRREIIEGTDWAALSVNRQARLAGITLREIRSRGESRFYATATVASPVAVDLESFAALIEAPAEDAAYLAQRRDRFNGQQ
jgi:hypothetical protein